MEQVDQAVYETVHNSSIPAKDIASRIGMSHQILLNKANSSNETHKLTLRESIAIQLVTGDTSIHRSMGLELESVNQVESSKGLMETLVIVSKEHGDVVSSVYEALSDGKITNRENENCQREIDEQMKALERLRSALVSHKKTEPCLATVKAS